MFRQVSRGVQFPEWRREQQLPEQRRELLAFGAIERAEQPLLVLEVVDDRRVDELAALVRQGDEATTPVRRVRQALGTMSHGYLELDTRPGADARELVRRVAGLREPRTTIGGVNLVAGFRPELWAQLTTNACPPRLKGFGEPLLGADGYTLPATQHDVVVWLAGAAYDVVFDLSRGVVSALASHAALANEIVGWPYHRDLDLTGFVDGTENPTLVDATEAAIVEAGSPGEGGSVLLLQQWEHDAEKWETLAIAEQEQVMGRRKLQGDELDPRPETSHVARTDQDQFGRIFRRNIGYGTLTRHGTIFVGFSRDRERLDAMLESMIARRGGSRDRLTDFAHAVTGAYYFVPSSEALAFFAAEPAS